MRTLIDKLPAFASGIVASAIAFVLITTVGAQEKQKVIVACADAEGTMRLNDPPGPCRPGERRLVLKVPELEDPKKEEPADKKVAELDKRLRDLEGRNRSGRLQANRVTAPFEVVDEIGRRVFYVDVGTVQAYNTSNTVVARIVANEHGGYFEGRSATAKVSATIGASDQQVGVIIQENDRRRVNLGRNDKGRYGLRIFGPTEKMVAGLGESTIGTGIGMVADAEGTVKARIYSTQQGAGMIEVLNGQGTGVATMSGAGLNGAGLLQLTNASGTVMVEAGVSKDGIGVVRTGPAGFNSGVGFVGLPTSYIQGKK